MPQTQDDIDQLTQEHLALLHLYGAVQSRCSEQVRQQVLEIERLQAQVIQLRAQVIMRDSAWAWGREALWPALLPVGATADATAIAGHEEPPADLELLESSLRTADLVICQTGCIAHGAYWRVEDHCKRTGKPCVLVEQPEALRIVRVHPSGRAEQLVPSAPGAARSPAPCRPALVSPGWDHQE
ncbi:DUF2325 domain-containing protein [Comamonas humi]